MIGMAKVIGYVVVAGTCDGDSGFEDGWQLCEMALRKRSTLQRDRDGYDRVERWRAPSPPSIPGPLMLLGRYVCPGLTPEW